MLQEYQLDWIKIVDFFGGRLFLGVELFPEPNFLIAIFFYYSRSRNVWHKAIFHNAKSDDSDDSSDDSDNSDYSDSSGKSSTPRKVLPREKVYPGKNPQF